jgi:hypothetical protein
MRKAVLNGKAKPAQSARDKAIEAAVDQFMKSIDHAARREIEKRMRKAIAAGTLKPGDSVTAGMGLKSSDAGLDVTVYGKISL